MTYTNIDNMLFETGDILTEPNILTYLLNNQRSMEHLLDVTTSDSDVVSTASETTLYSVTVTGGTLGSTGMVLMELLGDFLHNNAGADTMTVRVKFGGTTLIDVATNWNTTTGSARKPWRLEVHVCNRGATNSQLVTLRTVTEFPSASSPTAGIGSLVTSDARTHGLAQATAAVDTTVDQALLVTVQWSASSANNSWRRRWARTLVGQN